MLSCSKLIVGGRGLARALLKRAATVELDWDVRQKSRFDAIDSTGRAFGVFLPRGTLVRGGDVLVLEDGSLVRLGNRHVPIELQREHLKIEPDHVLADMLRAMHLTVVTVQEAFEPEAGAYSSHAHSHGTHDHKQHH
ncbi:MAG: urease accessory protein UreE [Betaproteobacteria bacterium]|nr:urease accessory protein UreE [Betaproteobacteria bacterium]